MQDRLTNRITLFVAASGAVLAALTTLIAGVGVGLGAVVGALVATTNWLALKWLLGRVLKAPPRRRTGLMLLLVAKMGLLFAVCWVLIVRFGVDPIGLLVGLSSLFVGITLGTLGAGAGNGAAEEHGEVVEEEG